MSASLDPLDNTQDIVYSHDFTGKITLFNRAALQLCGYTRQEALKHNIRDVISEDYRDAALCMMHRKLGGESVPPYELGIIAKDGNTIAVEVNSKLLFDDGKPVGVLGVARDITERKRTEKALRESEAKFRAVAETALCAICIARGPKLLYVNPAAVSGYGGTLEEMLSLNAFDLVAPDHREQAIESFRARSESGGRSRYELKTVTKSGEIRWYDVSARMIEIEGEPASLSTAFDITDRKRSEQALQESEAKFRAVAELAVCAICISDGSKLLYVNPSAVAGYGGTLDEMLSMNALDTIAPDSREQVMAYARARATGDAPSRYELKTIRKSGEIRWNDVSSRRIEYQGKPATLTTAFDITEQKRAVVAIQESEARYRSLFENVPDGVFRITRDGKILAANPALVEMLGYDSEQDLQTVNILAALCSNPEERLANLKQLDAGVPLRNFEHRVRRRDGREIVGLQNTRGILDENGAVVCYEGTLTDITDRKSLEEKLRHAQKMEAVGRLAGGIAHDFNNLLTVISGYSGLVKNRLGAADPSYPHVLEIEKAATRATLLVRQLLAFSRRQILQPVSLDLNELIREMEDMLRRLIGEHILLNVRYGTPLGSVRADPTQIQQIVMNLAVNARDAMPDGGELTISTQLNGGEVLFRVSDNGTGMDETTRAHVFEPFFTTKDVDKGTGLGLSTVHGIVEQSGGRISIESELGRGTAISIWLPCQQVER